jgi:hypothetical protein
MTPSENVGAFVARCSVGCVKTRRLVPPAYSRAFSEKIPQSSTRKAYSHILVQPLKRRCFRRFLEILADFTARLRRFRFAVYRREDDALSPSTQGRSIQIASRNFGNWNRIIDRMRNPWPVFRGFDRFQIRFRWGRARATAAAGHSSENCGISFCGIVF